MSKVSIEDLARWGLLKSVRKEQLKDELLNGEAPLTSEQKKQVISEWFKKNNISTNQELSNCLAKELIKKSHFQQRIERDWLWRKWCLEKFGNYHLKNHNQVEVKYSLIRVKDKDLINELYLRIKENESSFKAIAENFSEGQEKKSGGKVGPVPIHTLHPILTELLENAVKGELLAPRKIENWWIIVTLDEIYQQNPKNQRNPSIGSFELANMHLNKILEKRNDSFNNLDS